MSTVLEHKPEVFESVNYYDKRRLTNAAKRWVWFGLDVIQPERKSELSWLAVGGEETSCPCLQKYGRGFIPRGRAALLEMGGEPLPMRHMGEMQASAWQGLPSDSHTASHNFGFVPVYRVVSQIFGSYPWTLAFAIGVIVLPYAFRPIAANLAGVDVTILSEAGRSLGANWGQVLWRVILPNLRRGILSACFITIAVVLGEFTIASFASQNTFQTALFLLQQTDPYVGVIFALVALIFTFAILLIIGRIGSIGRNRKES